MQAFIIRPDGTNFSISTNSCLGAKTDMSQMSMPPDTTRTRREGRSRNAGLSARRTMLSDNQTSRAIHKLTKEVFQIQVEKSPLIITQFDCASWRAELWVDGCYLGDNAWRFPSNTFIKRRRIVEVNKHEFREENLTFAPAVRTLKGHEG